MTTPETKEAVKPPRASVSAKAKSTVPAMNSSAKDTVSAPKMAKNQDPAKPVVRRTARNPKAEAPATSIAKVASEAKIRVKKIKFARDSFTMPENEYEALGVIKKNCISDGVEVKKSQLFRIALILLKSKTTAELQILIKNLPPLKQGRPKKHKK